MYTIIMNDNKGLERKEIVTLYQREKLVDKFRFLLPLKYEEFDLSKFTVNLKYTDQGNVPHSEVLVLSDELYKDVRLVYYLPVDTDLTRFAGDIKIHLTLTYYDVDTKKSHVLHTGTTTITISPMRDIYAFVPDSNLEAIDQKMLELDARIQATERIAEIYDSEKADDLSYENNELQLLSNGEKIGNPVVIDASSVLDKDGVPVIDLNSSEDTPIVTPEEDEDDNVVEFGYSTSIDGEIPKEDDSNVVEF